MKGFFLTGTSYDVGVFALFLFQMVFMDTAVTIPTGAMAERWKWASFCVFALFMGGFVYPIFANWVWGAGWLSALGANFHLGHGHVDFAGSSVVHMVGGVAALAGAIVLGPRIGKFTKSGEPVAIPGHDLTLAITGTFILAFGWFGFNPGSTLAGGDLRISVVATNTMMAGTAGALVAMVIVWMKFGKPDPGMMVNGMLAGLVAITAPCAFVDPWAAAVIGTVAGVFVVIVATFVDTKLRIDDPVGAFAVHGANGAWGVLSIGLFANGKYGAAWNGTTEGVAATAKGVSGIFYGIDPGLGQLGAQAIGVLTIFIVFGGLSYAFFKIQNAIMKGGIRPPADMEIGGMDLPEMGALAYPDFEFAIEASAPEIGQRPLVGSSAESLHQD
jgi:Amt family ammonium transporter